MDNSKNNMDKDYGINNSIPTSVSIIDDNELKTVLNSAISEIQNLAEYQFELHQIFTETTKRISELRRSIAKNIEAESVPYPIMLQSKDEIRVIKSSLMSAKGNDLNWLDVFRHQPKTENTIK